MGLTGACRSHAALGRAWSQRCSRRGTRARCRRLSNAERCGGSRSKCSSRDAAPTGPQTSRMTAAILLHRCSSSRGKQAPQVPACAAGASAGPPPGPSCAPPSNAGRCHATTTSAHHALLSSLWSNSPARRRSSLCNSSRGRASENCKPTASGHQGLQGLQVLRGCQRHGCDQGLASAQ